MKKQLLAGTALAAAVMFAAGGAVAADKKMMKPSISVNGYTEYVVGAVIESEVDQHAASLDVHTDTEIQFNGRAELDSGIKLHMRWDLVGETNADQVDETWLAISGSFGQVILGATEPAASKMITKYAGSWATGVGPTLSFDGDEWVKRVDGAPWDQARLSMADSEKLTYISPNFNGFQVGASYIPYESGENTNAVQPVNASGRSNGVSAAATYGGKFDQVTVGLGVGLLAIPGNLDSDVDREDWLAAAKVGFGPVSVAVAYKRSEHLAHELADAGIKYVQGANSFSLGGMQVTPDDGDASYTAVIASYARSLGPGVKTHASIHWIDSENADGDTNTGTGVGVGVAMSF